MRALALSAVALVMACGAVTASNPSPPLSPTPSTTPGYLIGVDYTYAINLLSDSSAQDQQAYGNSQPGSDAASTAARKLASDYQTLLDNLDKISFPPTAQGDVSAFRKAAVALQVFWSNVSISDSNYSGLALSNLTDTYNTAGILLGHDLGLSPVVGRPSPTPP